MTWRDLLTRSKKPPVLPYPDEPFHEKPITLSDEQREELQRAFSPVRDFSAWDPVGVSRSAVPDKKELERRGAIVKTCVPEVVEAMKEAMQGHSHRPIVVKNLPEVEARDVPSATALENSADCAALGKLYSPPIAQALLYAALVPDTLSAETFIKHFEARFLARDHYEHGFPVMEKRAYKEGILTKQKSQKSFDIHYDRKADDHSEWLLNIVASPRNIDHAATRFIDFKRLFHLMGEDAAKIVAVTTHLPSGEPHYESLAAYRSYPYPEAFIHSELDVEKSDPGALRKYAQALRESTVEIDAQPGDMVIWPNLVIHHQATNGYIPIEDGSLGRILMHMTVGRPSATTPQERSWGA